MSASVAAVFSVPVMPREVACDTSAPLSTPVTMKLAVFVSSPFRKFSLNSMLTSSPGERMPLVGVGMPSGCGRCMSFTRAVSSLVLYTSSLPYVLTESMRKV